MRESCTVAGVRVVTGEACGTWFWYPCCLVQHRHTCPPDGAAARTRSNCYDYFYNCYNYTRLSLSPLRTLNDKSNFTLSRFLSSPYQKTCQTHTPFPCPAYLIPPFPADSHLPSPSFPSQTPSPPPPPESDSEDETFVARPSIPS